MFLSLFWDKILGLANDRKVAQSQVHDRNAGFKAWGFSHLLIHKGDAEQVVGLCGLAVVPQRGLAADASLYGPVVVVRVQR